MTLDWARDETPYPHPFSATETRRPARTLMARPRKSMLYTRSGDAGTTALFGGERVPKDSRRVEAYGVVDESGKRSRRAVFVIERGGNIAHVEPWFQPGNPGQYEAIFRALGFE